MGWNFGVGACSAIIHLPVKETPLIERKIKISLNLATEKLSRSFKRDYNIYKLFNSIFLYGADSDLNNIQLLNTKF